MPTQKRRSLPTAQRPVAARRRRCLPAAACALMLCLLTLPGAAPNSALAAQPLSGLSPYPDGGDPTSAAAVTACNGAAQVGRLYRNSESEPHLAVNPTDPNNLIAVWHQDRWSDGGAQGNFGAYSLDGGLTWAPVDVPFTRCSGALSGSAGDYERASDPWIRFGPDGAAHYMALVFNRATKRNGMVVAKSTDGGVTWGGPVVIRKSNANGGNSSAFVQLHDKNSLTPDPFDPNLVYATWTLFRNNNVTVLFSRSTDGGASWGPARPINNNEIAVDPPDHVTFRQDVQIVVLPDGTLVNAFFRSVTDPQGGSRIEMAIFRSYDQGRHWEHRDVVVAQAFSTVGFDVELGIFVRGAANFPDLAVDRDNGNLYMAWQDARLSPFGASNILITRSTDGGDSWSPPVPVTNSPFPAAFLPAVEVADDGTVGVLFYDNRLDVFGDAEFTTEVYLRTLDADLNITGEVRLTDQPFDMRQMLLAGGGYFPGDYVGLEAAGDDFVAAFTVADNLGLPVDQPDGTVLTLDSHDRQDIVFVRVDR